MKTKTKVWLIAAVFAVALGAGAFIFHGTIFPSTAASALTKNAAAYSTVAATKGDITSTVSASGQLEPNTIVTIRPDSNMPARKIVKVYVTAGERVAANAVIAEIDATGLDLTLKSAEANYQAQRARLENLEAKPVGMDLAVAEASLTSARVTEETAEVNFDNVKALADKGLASKSSLAEYENALASAKAGYESQKLSYQNVGAQSADADIKAQESAVATADYNRQMAKIVLQSASIRSPSAGVVAEVLVGVGDLVSPSTSIAYVVDTNPIVLAASVNENDVPAVKVGQTAVVTQAAYSDQEFTGVVKSIDLRASTSNNVSTFAANIEVPNNDGKLLWGMNADAEISVVSLKNVLTLPSSAVKTSNGAATVTLVDRGALVPHAVKVGATDGTKTQILSGLEEGQQVVSKSAKSAATSTTTSVIQEGPGGVGDIGSILGGGPGGPPPGGP